MTAESYQPPVRYVHYIGKPETYQVTTVPYGDEHLLMLVNETIGYGLADDNDEFWSRVHHGLSEVCPYKCVGGLSD